MSQTSVLAGGQPVGVAGQIADSGLHDIVSGFNAESTSQMAFGIGVRAGTAERAYLIATGFSNVIPILGVNVFSTDHNRAGTVDSAGRYSGDLGGSGLLPNASLQVMRKGRVLVPVEQALVFGQRAYCRGIATGSSSNSALVGVWSATNYASAGAGGSYHVDVTPAAVFMSGSYTAADGSTLVAVLEVDFTNKL